jgi:hypothetical protein
MKRLYEREGRQKSMRYIQAINRSITSRYQ